ncbi:hypothetical protein WA026_002421 [Henosepilachna vigintioctopunctata]|uniref:Uncharacterized protein n=1 Tax=Henosepilachna vigintioctopunctata TaxID=420089 RepID=A0AAW1TZN1_9CUCU
MNLVSSCFFLVVELQLVRSLVTDEEYGRLPHIFETDNFDSCMLLGDESLYCTIEFHQLNPIDARHPSNSWKQIQELINNPKNYRHDRLRHGICIPLTCPDIEKNLTDDSTFKDNLALCYNKKFESKGLYGTINRMFCQTNQPLPYDSYDIAVITFLVLYISFIILASFYEGVARYKSKIEYSKITGTSYGKLMSCFSLPNNFYRLKRPSENKSLRFIQGIRFYNMILVITTHCIMGTSSVL